MSEILAAFDSIESEYGPGAAAGARAEFNLLLKTGDTLAGNVERRWSGPGGCDCAVCSAAKEWQRVASVSRYDGEPRS